MNSRLAPVLISIAFLSIPAVTRADAPRRTFPRGPVPVPAAELKWTDLDPSGAPGVKVADLWGDHKKGAFGAIFKLPAGFAAPLHTHTHSMKVVIISGRLHSGARRKGGIYPRPGIIFCCSRAVTTGIRHVATRPLSACFS
jgi:hypothetical protein